MITLGNRVQTTTRDFLMPILVDTVLEGNKFAGSIVRKAKKWTGKRMQVPVKFAKNTTVTSWSGFDQLSTAATDNRVLMNFDPGFVTVTTALPLDEISTSMKSGAEEAVLNLVKLQIESDTEDLADGIGTQFWGTGTGNSNKDLQGIGAIVDDGSSVATFGGLSRSQYTGLQAVVTASGGTLTLDKMTTLYNDISNGGGVNPTIGYAIDAVHALYEKLLVSQERYVISPSEAKKGFTAGTGAKELAFKGIPIVRDRKATAQTLFMWDETFIDWYALPVEGDEPVKLTDDIEGNDYTKSEVQGYGFTWSGWVKPTNQRAWIGFTNLGGQLIGRNPLRSGKLTGVTGV